MDGCIHGDQESVRPAMSTLYISNSFHTWYIVNLLLSTGRKHLTEDSKNENSTAILSDNKLILRQTAAAGTLPICHGPRKTQEISSILAVTIKLSDRGTATYLGEQEI
jgi:hypothetical protein